MMNNPSSFNQITPAMFHILLALSAGEQHGYRIMQMVNADGQFKIGPGTLYGSIKKMLGAGLIEECGERPDPAIDDERRRYYRITNTGSRAFQAELARMERLVRQARSLTPIVNVKGEVA